MLRAITGGPSVPWAELALARGHFDQAHFDHDVRASAGLHPTAHARATRAARTTSSCD